MCSDDPAGRRRRVLVPYLLRISLATLMWESIEGLGELMKDTGTQSVLDLTGKTITTYILYEVHEALADCCEGDRVEAVTDALAAIDNDLRAWSRTTGNSLVEVSEHGTTRRYVIAKGAPKHAEHKLAAIISDDGLFELLSPLGFALGAALEGHDVSLYFQGPAVRVLAPGFRARMHGLGRPFSRFPRDGLAKVGHIPPQDKLRQMQQLGACLFACGPSMEHYKVDPTNLALSDVTIAAYLTFMEQMSSADIHLVA
jgi:predicted peroxiredoxin/TusA-related sulfurtransferase